MLAGAGAIIRERAAAGVQLGQAQATGQAKANEIAVDTLVKIPANVVIRTANDLKNTAIDAIAHQPSSVVPPVAVELIKHKTDIARLELKSEMMNRDLSGKVTSDPNAITAGKTLVNS